MTQGGRAGSTNYGPETLGPPLFSAHSIITELLPPELPPSVLCLAVLNKIASARSSVPRLPSLGPRLLRHGRLSAGATALFAPPPAARQINHELVAYNSPRGYSPLSSCWPGPEAPRDRGFYIPLFSNSTPSARGFVDQPRGASTRHARCG